MKPWIEKIRQLMKERGITQEALASELGRGQSWVNHKLSGRRKVNVEDIVLIARALNIEPSALLNNVTNYDRLADNFLGTAEPDEHYSVDPLEELRVKLQLLESGEAARFVEQTLAALDELITKKETE